MKDGISSVCVLILSLMPLSAMGENVEKGRFDGVLSGQDEIEVVDSVIAEIACPQKKPCRIQLDELNRAIRRFYEDEDFACGKAFRFQFSELDCGMNGTPDLMLHYEGLCIYGRDAEENSGLWIPVYVTDDGNYYIYDARDYWERSILEISENNAFKEYGLCGYHCFIQGEGVINELCRFEYAYKLSCSGMVVAETAMGGISILDITVGEKRYYGLCGFEMSEAYELEMLTKFKSHLDRIEHYWNIGMKGWPLAYSTQFISNMALKKMLEVPDAQRL